MVLSDFCEKCCGDEVGITVVVEVDGFGADDAIHLGERRVCEAEW